MTEDNGLGSKDIEMVALRGGIRPARGGYFFVIEDDIKNKRIMEIHPKHDIYSDIRTCIDKIGGNGRGLVEVEIMMSFSKKSETPKKKRGRPRKNAQQNSTEQSA